MSAAYYSTERSGGDGDGEEAQSTAVRPTPIILFVAAGPPVSYPALVGTFDTTTEQNSVTGKNQEDKAAGAKPCAKLSGND